MFSSVSPIERQFETFRQAMDQLVDQAFVGTPISTLWSRQWTGFPLDVYATQDKAVLLAALPGLKPDNLEITVHQNTVSLGGSVADYAKGLDQVTWYLHELPSGEFRRSVTLPFEVDPDKTTATVEDGIVKVVLPKAEHAIPRKIAIQGSGQTQAIGEGNTPQK